MKLNPDRVRRHMARSTPDRVQIHVDVYDDDAMKVYQDWLQHFAKRMKVKHGEGVQIEIFRDQSLALYPQGSMFFAKVVIPDKPEGFFDRLHTIEEIVRKANQKEQ